MQVTVEQGAIQASNADTIIVNLFDDVTVPGGATGAVDQALDGGITDLIVSGDISGKAGEVTVLYPRAQIAATRVLVVGLGSRDGFDFEGVRQASAAAALKARALNSKRVATIVHGAGVAGLPAGDAAEATIEGALLALYQFDHYKQARPSSSIEEIVVVENDVSKLADITAGVAAAQAIFAGVAVARDLVNSPPNYATPEMMAETATEIARDHGLTALVGDRAWAASHKMGAFLAVGQGAGFDPRFIVLEHNVNRTELETIVLVGKGITFDTGGISIKPSANMGNMKSDMGGAAAVIGAMRAVAELDLPLRVIGITPCTENMPDANAYRPSDVITASNGKTIEIISTDAEGRMALADALVYAGRYEPAAVIDLATLTGSAVVALGKGVAAAMFSNQDALSEQLAAAGSTAQERLWRLPLYKDYRRSIDSLVADMKNSGGRAGGVGTSAVFLEEFTDYNWAHLDIAGMALTEKDKGYVPAGGTGFGVRLLVQFLRNRVAAS